MCGSALVVLKHGSIFSAQNSKLFNYICIDFQEFLSVILKLSLKINYTLDGIKSVWHWGVKVLKKSFKPSIRGRFLISSSKNPFTYDFWFEYLTYSVCTPVNTYKELKFLIIFEKRLFEMLCLNSWIHELLSDQIYAA